MSSNIGPEGGDGAGAPAPDPYAPLREAGFDPDATDWAEVAAKAAYVDALTDPNRHFDTLEGSLREWGHLEEGQGLADLFGPPSGPPEPSWGSPGEQQSQGDRRIIGYDPDDQPIYSAPSQPVQPEFNPQALEERLLSRVQEEIRGATDRTRQEMAANQMALDLEHQMEQAKTSNGLTDEEANFLWSNVRNKIGSMQGLTDASQIQGIVDQEWQRIEALATARLQRIAAQQGNAPRTTQSNGAPPVDNGQQTGESPWDSMMRSTANRLGIEQ